MLFICGNGRGPKFLVFEKPGGFVPPKIDRKNLKDLTVSAGSMVKLEADVVGEPPAVVTWKFESVELESSADKSMTITNLPYNTKLVLLSTSGLLTDLILQRTFKPQILHLPAAISHGENPRMTVELPSNTTRWRNLTLTVACGYLVEDLKIAKLMSET